MKTPLTRPNLVLFSLQKKFKDAACECSLKDYKNQTALVISYSDFLSRNNLRQIA